jgi:hypothetical protein
MFERTRPATELLHVVAHGGKTVRMGLSGLVQIFHDVVDGVPGNQVAQRFLTGDEPNGLTLVLGNVISE